MGFIEFIPPSQELKADLEAVKSVGSGKDPDDAMAEKAVALRDLLRKWEGRLSQGFVDDVDSIIQIATKPPMQGEEPQLPNEKAFDLSTADQVMDYVLAVKKAWIDLLAFFETRAFYAKGEVKSTQPEDRFMMITSKINRLLQTLVALPYRDIEVGPGQRFRIADTGVWHGHMIAVSNSPAADLRFRKLSCPNLPLNMGRWVYHDSLPIGEVGDENMNPNPDAKKPEKPAKAAKGKAK